MHHGALEKKMAIEPLYLSINAAAETFGLSRSSIYRAAHAGLLEIVKVGRCSLISMQSLKALMDNAPRQIFAKSQPSDQSKV
jgi:excisionase family DNA binding protein